MIRDIEKARAAVLKASPNRMLDHDPGKPSRWPTVRLVSAIVAAGSVGAMLLWDLVPAFTEARDDTISEVFRDLLWTRYGPGFSMLTGYFMGHLVINSNRGPRPVWSMVSGFVVCAGMFAACHFSPISTYHPAIFAAIGCALGWAVWPQARK